MNNRRALGITFAILGIICVIFAAIHFINEPIADSITILTAYMVFGILFFVTGKNLSRSTSEDKPMQTYR